MKKLAIIVRDDAYDRLYTPLTFAYVAARRGLEVDLLFVLWAVRVLTEEGAAAVRIDPLHAAEEGWLKDRLRSAGDPVEIREFIGALKGAGNVGLYGCKLAAQTFDVRAEQLIPEADGIVDSMWFLEGKAAAADHCQYF